MKLTNTISATSSTLRVLAGLIVLGFGCTEDDLPARPGVPLVASSLATSKLIEYVLKPTLGESFIDLSLPQWTARLRHTAPSDGNDRAYWQWYSQTLMTTCATTEYRRTEEGSILLSWEFNRDDCQGDPAVTAGTLILQVREYGGKLDLLIRAVKITTQRERLEGTYQLMWLLPRIQEGEAQYTLLEENNRMIIKR